MDKLDQNNFREQTAEILLKLEAIKLSPNNPFTWASGWKSPIYCDNRIVLSYPKVRDFLSTVLSEKIQEDFDGSLVIAGVATGAIGIGMLVAQKLNLPFIYIRPEPKKHGKQNQIEGKFTSGDRVLVIEDLISTGKSSLNAANALKDSGAEILGMMGLFTYGFSNAEEEFRKAKIKLQTLCDYQHLLSEAINIGTISEMQLESLKTWREDPSAWSPKIH